MKVKQVEFSNGARLCFNPMPDMASVSIGIWVKTGSRYEKSEISGISHFLEHLLFKGTKTRTALQISQEIEGIGGMLNGFTSEEYTCYYVKVLKHHLSKAVSILFDMILNPLLKPKDMEKEKGIIIEELNMYLDMPSHYVDDLLSEITWSGHPLGRRILGSPETVRGVNKQKIIKYMKRNYSSANIVVAVAGNSSMKAVKDLVSPYIKKLNRGKTVPFMPYENTQSEPSLKMVRKKTEQTHLAMGFKSFSRLDPKRYRSKLLSIILGGNMSSRLFQQVREKHCLAYAIHSSLNQYIDTGSFEISTGIKNKKTEQAIELIVKEIKKLKKRPVEKHELDMAKEYIIGQIMLSLENTKSNMIQIGENMLTVGHVTPLKEILAKIRDVSRDDLITTAHEVFSPSNVNLALVGDCPNAAFVRAANPENATALSSLAPCQLPFRRVHRQNQYQPLRN